MGAFIDYLSFASSLFPVIVGWFLFRFLPKDLKHFLYYFTFAALYDLGVTLLALYGINNIRELNMYTIIETYILLSLFSSYVDDKRIKKWFWVIGILFTLVWIWINLIANTLSTFTTQDESIKCLLMMFICASLLFYLSNEIRIPLLSNYKFWLIVAFFIYFSATFVVFSTSTWIFTEMHDTAMRLTWTIHGYVTIFINCIASYAYICFYRRRNLFY